MADSVTTAAPAAAPTTTTTATPEAKPAQLKADTQNAENKGAKKDAPPAHGWTEESAKQFEELLKLKGSKLKMKHEETPISSVADFEKALQLAQRGLGGAKMAEDFKKREAEYQVKLKASEEKEALIEAARSGDFEARKKLGLVSRQEEEAKRKEYEDIPPEVRELLEERNTYAKRLAELEAAQQTEKQQALERQQQAQLQEARQVAMYETEKVLEALQFSPDRAEAFMPYVAGAIADLAEAGLVIGEDMTTEVIVNRIRQMRDEATEGAYKGLKLDARLKHVLTDLETAPDDDILKYIPEKLRLKIAKLQARAIAAKKAQPQQPVTLTKDTQPERKNAPLRTFSFVGPRWQK